jgi:hypothetical protein
VSWRVFVTTAVDPDLARMTDADRLALNEDLFAWVASGPPRQNKRVVFDVELFEDVVPSGHRVTYFVNEAEKYVAVMRVRPV